MRSGACLLALLVAGAAPLAAQIGAGTVVTTLTLFAGNDDGLWRSRDWGGSWELVRDPALLDLGAVRVVQPLGRRVWLGGAGGLFLSEDFGQTWKRRGELKDVYALSASRFPEADPTVFVGTDRGLFKSADDGERFEPTALQGIRVTRLEWPGPALVVGTDSGLRVTLDNARTWHVAPRGLASGRVRSLAPSAYFLIDPVLFAGVAEAGVQRSTDGGATFTLAGLAGRRVDDLMWMGLSLYAASDDGLYRSDDTGRSFARIGAGLGDAAVTSLLFPLAPDSAAEFFVGTERGLFRTLDGGLHFEPTGFKAAVAVVATFPPPAPPRQRKR